MRKMYRKEKYKTRAEWLANRGMGGSSVSALFNENPYMTKLDIYCSSIAKKETPENEVQNESTKYGTDLEPMIREMVKRNFETKFRVQSPNGFTQYRRIDKPFMTATLDGILTDKESGDKYILEIKTHDVRGTADLDNWNNHIPNNYYIQVLHYLAVLNDFKGAKVVAKLRWLDYDTGETIKEEIRYYPMIMRADHLQEIELVEKTQTDFVREHIEKGIPPKVEIEIMGKEE